METQRKLLIMTRHGRKDGKNLMPETVPALYRQTGSYLGNFFEEHNVKPDQVFVRHSNQVRTRLTADAILSGAFDYLPVPQKQEDLGELEQHLLQAGVEIREHSGLCYPADVKFNEKAYNQNETLFMGEWVAAPNKRTLAGVENIPFGEVRRKARPALIDALGYLLQSDKQVGVLATHGGIVESLSMDAVESAIGIPVDSLFQIGGYFPQEDFAALICEPLNGKAILYRPNHNGNSVSYPVSIDKLLRA